MKKYAFLALVALGLSASAGSIDWKLNTGAAANYMVGKDGNKLTGTAYLLLNSDYAGTSFTSKQEIVDLALGGEDGAVQISNGVNTTVKTTSDAKLTAPNSYSFIVVIFDSNSNSFYTAGPKSQTAYNLTGDEYTDAKQFSLSMSELKATAATRGSQTWTSVPEPSTAALALAGLALLLKRRKA